MKRIIPFILAAMGSICLSTAAPSPDVRAICGKYVGEEGVRIVATSPAKFASTGRLPLVGMEDGTLDLSPAVRTLTSSHLLISINDGVNRKLDADIAELLRSANYDLLCSSNEGGQLSAIYVIAEADTISSFLLCTIDQREVVLYNVEGRMPRQQLEEMIAKAVPSFSDDTPAAESAEAPAPEPSDLLSQRNDETAPTSRVEMSENDASNYTDIYAYIRARVPDVMRGPISVNSQPDGPMFIVDGIQTTDISYLRPIDIHSVEGVKGSATAIYGFRAAGGVIVITTKAAHIQREAEERERRAVKEARRAEREAKKAARKNNR